MLHRFAAKFEVERREIEVIMEHLPAGEAALLDQVRKPMPQLETLEPISDNEEEDQEATIGDTQQTEDCDDDLYCGKTDLSNQTQCRRSRKRLPGACSDDDDNLPEMPIHEGTQGRSGRIRKQPRLPDGFQIDLS
jgi:hypothetical protein